MSEPLLRPVLYAVVDGAVAAVTLAVVGLPVIVAGVAYWFLRQ